MKCLYSSAKKEGKDSDNGARGTMMKATDTRRPKPSFATIGAGRGLWWWRERTQPDDKRVYSPPKSIMANAKYHSNTIDCYAVALFKHWSTPYDLE